MERGDLDAAIIHFQDAYRRDPADQEVLMRIAELRQRQRRTRMERKPTPPEPVAVEPEALAEDELFYLEEGQPLPGIGERRAPAADGGPGQRDWGQLIAGDASQRDPGEAKPQEAAASAAGFAAAAAQPSAVPGGPGAEEAWSLVAVGLYGEASTSAAAVPGLLGRWLEARATAGSGDQKSARLQLREAIDDASEDDPVYPDALFELAGLSLGLGRLRPALRLLEELSDVAPAWRTGEVQAKIRGVRLLMLRKG